MSRAEELQQLSIAWNDAWNSRDPDLLAGFMAGAGTYYEPELSEPMPGDPGVRAAAEKTWAEWPSAAFELVTCVMRVHAIVRGAWATRQVLRCLALPADPPTLWPARASPAAA
ncbi:MAG: hypothetical protein JRJ84_25450 [Deltaproteobacteria bacterium]|nr:hypothetical protein [Deltaproteobacteria bacterium]